MRPEPNSFAGTTGKPSVLLAANPLITGVTSDSRQVRPGFLFVALAGTRGDGRAYIDQAISAGAVAVLIPPDTTLSPAMLGIVVLEDARPRLRLARLAAALHCHQPAHVVAVTGTSGKTSTVQFTRQLWEISGCPAASIGTLGLVAPGIERAGSLTTPDPTDLHADLAGLVTMGVDHVALEASSHGLDQNRLDGVRFAAAAFTNLSHDHLDYHPSMAAYFHAKARLFSELLPPDAAAVLNADAPEAQPLVKIAQARGQKLITYGATGADFQLLSSQPLAHGQRIRIAHGGQIFETMLPLAGAFQIGNALAAVGLVTATGLAPDRALAAMARLKGVPGRLELVSRLQNGAAIYVDYAHKPEALAAVMAALRPHASRKLSLVFGCGGDRDRAKRPIMGGLARRLADRVVITDDNPRNECAATIRAEIRAGCPDAIDIADRRQAINEAIAHLETGDVLVIAGKGHETSQITNAGARPFDDRLVARSAAADREGKLL